MRPFCPYDWAFDRHVVNLAVVFLSLSFVLEVKIGASGDGVYDFKGWEIIALLGRLLVLCRWRRRSVGLRLWLNCLGVAYGICYL
jgi:hypothetical protein